MIDIAWQSSPLPAPADMYLDLLLGVVVAALAVHTFRTLTGRTCFALLTGKGPAHRAALTHIGFLTPTNVVVAAMTSPWVWTRQADDWMRHPMLNVRDLYYALSWPTGLLLWASLAATTLLLFCVAAVALLRPGKDHENDTAPKEDSAGARFQRDRYRTDLSNEEYLALQGFLYSRGGAGWLLLAGPSSVMGWHWKDDNDTQWHTADAALAGFFPDHHSREAALSCGWRVVPDHTDSGRLKDFLAAELSREDNKQIKHPLVDLDDLPGEAPPTPEESELFSQLYPDHYQPDSLQHT